MLDGVEGVQHLEDPPVVLPDRVADGLQCRAAVCQLPARLVERLPGRLAARSGLPRARVAFDALERILGIAPALSLDERVNVQLSEAGKKRASLAGECFTEVPAP